MFITQLRYFVAVVDCQSFTKAAARCHTSQPNLSEQVQNLEGQIGLKLLDRSGRKIVPTERGRLLWERAKKIITDVDEAVHAVRVTPHVYTRIDDLDKFVSALSEIAASRKA